MKIKKILLLTTTILLFLCACTIQDNSSNEITKEEALEKIINNNAIILDVRKNSEYETNHIEGALNLYIEDITEENIKEIIDNYETEIILCDNDGSTTPSAQEKLKSLGYKNVYNMGSISKW